MRRESARVLDSVIFEGAPVALLDYPNHPNVGDSAIFLGELEYLRRRSCQIMYMSDLASHDAARLKAVLPPDGLILLHGGGNLGDLWPIHRRFAERVVQDNPGHRIVILPQTTNFRKQQSIESTRSAFGSHDGLTLIARDRSSSEWASANIDCRVELAPDVARQAFWHTG